MKVVILAYLFLNLIVLPVNADIIYFKDGMKTICQEKAWEEDDQIKCEYAGWVLTYPKADVLRVLKTRVKKQNTPTEKNDQKRQIITKDSGKKTGYRAISRGRFQVRRLLYMAALVAIRFNPRMKKIYDKLLAKGKLKKVAIVAVMRKMIIIMNAIIKNGTPWQSERV